MPEQISAYLGPVLITGLILFSVYRRVRRNIGRQQLRPWRMKARAVLLAVIALALVTAPWVTQIGVLAALAGAVVGVGVAIYALRHTNMEFTSEGTFYTGHFYIGLTLAGLFVARVAYRMIEVVPLMGKTVHAAGEAPAQVPWAQSPMAHSMTNPVTMALFCLMAAYYIAYYAGLLRQAKAGAPPTTPTDPSPELRELS